MWNPEHAFRSEEFHEKQVKMEGKQEKSDMYTMQNLDFSEKKKYKEAKEDIKR